MNHIPAKTYGYASNKDVKFSKYKGIYIKRFRSLNDCELELGSNITVISGKNGTMKSAILGLIAHPFNSPNGAKDAIGKPLKTNCSDVFKMSKKYDNQKYEYYLNLEDSNNKDICEYVSMYYVKNSVTGEAERLRVVVGKTREQGDGNFNLNTSYVNFKRLFPIIETKSAEKEDNNLSEEDKNFIKEAYFKIFQKTEYGNVSLVSDDKAKETLGPSNANYDFETISSGEDNLGHILLKLLAFKKYSTDVKNLQGVFCIDEIEASMHPIAQNNLFDFLFDFSKRYHVQIVVTTHSLSLIEYVIEKQEQINDKQKICLNMISTRFRNNGDYSIIKNPTYDQANLELTYKKSNEVSEKVIVILEDKLATSLFKKIIRKKEAKKHINCICDLTPDKVGNTCTFLYKIARNATVLLQKSIIVFDADVTQKISTLRTSAYKLPSVYGLCIEAEIIKYIMNLPEDSEFFQKYDKEKKSFINDFGKYSITNFEIEYLNQHVKSCKNWKESDENFNRYLGFYVSDNRDIFDEFEKSIYKDINSKLNTKLIDVE